MPRSVPSEEIELFRKVELLGEKGFNQSEAAADLGMSLHTLRTKIERHGLEMVNGVQVRAKLGGKRLADLLGDGEIVAAEEPVPA
jgi:hypothetical protein